MHPDLEKLIGLQRAESELRRVEAALAEVPRERGRLEAALQEEKARLEAAREALGVSQKNRRQHESSLQDLEAKRSKYKGQLMEVKTNKEYTAMLHEIESVEREIRGQEDQILAEMERAETLGAELKREEAAFRAAEERHRGELRALEEREHTLQQQAGARTAEREAIAVTLPELLHELFQRVARLRGSAVAEARDGMCQTCHVKLRLQMFVELKRNEAIVQCPACQRVLFYDAAVPAASPGP